MSEARAPARGTHPAFDPLRSVVLRSIQHLVDSCANCANTGSIHSASTGIDVLNLDPVCNAERRRALEAPRPIQCVVQGLGVLAGNSGTVLVDPAARNSPFVLCAGIHVESAYLAKSCLCFDGGGYGGLFECMGNTIEP